MKKKVGFSLLASLALLITILQIAPPSELSGNKSKIEANKLIAIYIYNEISKNFEKPIAVSKGISESTLVKDLLRRESSIDDAQLKSTITNYLNNISKAFKYTAVNIVSEKSKRYYTPKGIAKIINPEDDPNDDWYQFFIDSKKNQSPSIDRDKIYDYRWALFINSRINDEDGSLLGVNSIGVFIDDLQEELSLLEKKFHLKINLIDSNGFVTLDTNSQNIENAYISEALKDNATNANFTYTKKPSGGFRMTRYINDLDWYIVIQSFSNIEAENSKTVAAIILYVILATLIVLSLVNKKKPLRQDVPRVSEPIDFLTGLPNRNYLNEAYGELGIFNTTRYKSLAMFDIDRFKTTNESRDGNKILLDIVKFTKDMVDEQGIIFRWAGDEFVLFLEMEVEEAESRFNSLCAKVKESLDVTLSAGIVTVDLTESIKTNYHRAVQLCYIVKANGGNGVCVQK